MNRKRKLSQTVIGCKKCAFKTSARFTRICSFCWNTCVWAHIMKVQIYLPVWRPRHYSSTKRSMILSAAKDCFTFAWASWRAPWQYETAATCTGSTHHPFLCIAGSIKLAWVMTSWGLSTKLGGWIRAAECRQKPEICISFVECCADRKVVKEWTVANRLVDSYVVLHAWASRSFHFQVSEP